MTWTNSVVSYWSCRVIRPLIEYLELNIIHQNKQWVGDECLLIVCAN